MTAAKHWRWIGQDCCLIEDTALLECYAIPHAWGRTNPDVFGSGCRADQMLGSASV